MKTAVLAAFLLTVPLGAEPQDDAVSLDDVVQSAQAWAQENLDDNTLRMLQEADQKQVKAFFDEVQEQFQGEYVIDLAQLRETAKVVLPLLESHEETLPYAAWLKSRMDYLDAADELRLIVPPPKAEPGQPPPPPTNPAPALIRQVWTPKLANRAQPQDANPCVAELKPVFAKQGVPGQLVWIAEVESSFNPRARSPAGAAGLFQLMPDTAKRYGLKTWPIDERLKPEPSAGAAAQYLAYLHGHYNDWPLALAAYNAGEGTVDKLLKRHNAKTYDAIATHLPAETQLYVPKVEATVFRREGIELQKLDNG